MTAYIFSISIFLFGFVLVWLSPYVPDVNNFSASTFLAAFGSFICSMAIFGAYLEWRGRKDMLNQVFSEIGVALNLRDAGIAGVTLSSSPREISEKLRSAKKVAVAYLYSDRFLKDNFSDLKFCLSSGGRVELFFLHNNSQQISQLISSGWSEDEIKSSFASVRSLVEQLSNFGEIILKYHSNPRANTVVQIDDYAMISLVSISTGRMDVPRLAVVRGGILFQFIEEDLQRLRGQAIE